MNNRAIAEDLAQAAVEIIDDQVAPEIPAQPAANAAFLAALDEALAADSSDEATYCGKMKNDPNLVDPSRDGMEGAFGSSSEPAA